MPRVVFLQTAAYEKASVHFLAGALRRAGIEYTVIIRDLESDWTASLKEFSPDFITYSLFIDEEEGALEMLGEAKKLLPDAVTIVGGPCIAIFNTLHELPEIDFTLGGDGEYTLVEFITKYSAGEPVDHIDGLCGRVGSRVFSNPPQLIDIQEESCPPDRDLYYKYPLLADNPTKDFIGQRGCPFQCTYCYNAQLAKKFPQRYWRVRKVEDVINEIRYVRDKYGLSYVHFQDGTFNANGEWVNELLDAYIKNKLPPYLCNLRPHTVSPDFVKRLKESGCDRITFGVQSGNSRIRKLAGRPISNEKIIESCTLCREAGLRFGIDIIFGWPSETREEALETITLCRELHAETYHSNVMRYYPHLPITALAMETGAIDKWPTVGEIAKLKANGTQLIGEDKDFFVNMDKLFYPLIRWPRLEKFLLRLVDLPPNNVFLFVKNLHILKRSLRYAKTSQYYSIIKAYCIQTLFY